MLLPSLRRNAHEESSNDTKAILSCIYTDEAVWDESRADQTGTRTPQLVLTRSHQLMGWLRCALRLCASFSLALICMRSPCMYGKASLQEASRPIQPQYMQPEMDAFIKAARQNQYGLYNAFCPGQGLERAHLSCILFNYPIQRRPAYQHLLLIAHLHETSCPSNKTYRLIHICSDGLDTRGGICELSALCWLHSR